METQDLDFRYRGGKAAEGWNYAGEVGPFQGSMWSIYQHHTISPAGWRNLKLAAQEPVEHKANYWVAWNGERFSQSRDYVTAEKHRPDLLDAVRAFFSGASA